MRKIFKSFVVLTVITWVVFWMVKAWAFSMDPGVALGQKCETMDRAVMEAAAINKGCSDISTLVFVHICKGQTMDGKVVADDKTLGNTKVCSHPANDPRYAVLTQAFWFLADPAGPAAAAGNGPVTGNGLAPVEQMNIGGAAGNGLAINPVPVALGPYPTEAMCVEAERQVMPSNEKFWNEQDRKDAAARAAYKKTSEAVEAKYQARMDQLAKENPKPGRYKLWDGTVFNVCVNGNCGDHNGFWMGDEEPNKSVAFVQGKPGKSIPPRVPDMKSPPILPADTYTVDQECQSVSGWYKSISISGVK